MAVIECGQEEKQGDEVGYSMGRRREQVRNVGTLAVGTGIISLCVVHVGFVHETKRVGNNKESWPRKIFGGRTANREGAKEMKMKHSRSWWEIEERRGAKRCDV